MLFGQLFVNNENIVPVFVSTYIQLKMYVKLRTSLFIHLDILCVNRLRIIITQCIFRVFEAVESSEHKNLNKDVDCWSCSHCNCLFFFNSVMIRINNCFFCCCYCCNRLQHLHTSSIFKHSLNHQRYSVSSRYPIQCVL